MKKPSAVVSLLVTVAWFASPSRSEGCGIALSLWYYVRSAELIVVGRIDSLETRGFAPDRVDPLFMAPRRRMSASLRVLETWKGSPPSWIQVDLGEAFNESTHRVGEVLVLFLERAETGASRRSVSQQEYYEVYARELMEGSVQDYVDFPHTLAELDAMRAQADVSLREYESWAVDRWTPTESLPLDGFPEESDREAMESLVKLAVELQRDGVEDPDRIEWHVAAAERRATRWQGLMELGWLLDTPQEPVEINVSEDFSEPAESASEAPVAEKTRLTDEQLGRIAAGFVREPAVDDSDLTTLRLLADYPDVEVDRTAASIIEAGLLLRPIPDWVLKMVDVALRRYGDDFSARIGRDDRDPRGRPIHTGEGENTLPTIWEVARRELGIPAVAPAQVPAQAREDVE